MCSTIMELGAPNREGLLVPISIMVVYMDALGMYIQTLDSAGGRGVPAFEMHAERWAVTDERHLRLVFRCCSSALWRDVTWGFQEQTILQQCEELRRF